MRVHKIVSSIALFVPLITSALLTLLYTDAIQGVAAKDHAAATSTVTATGTVSPTYDHSSNANMNLHLSVELYNQGSFSEAPSCVHSFSSLQITNTHKSEVVVINSVETKPFGGANDDEILQVHSTFFQDRILKINPKSSVILPLNFFPQIPSYHHSKEGGEDDHNDRGGGNRGSNKRKNAQGLASISKVSAVDLSSLLKIDAMNIGQNGLHTVKTNVVISSSRGKYETKIDSSALRHNPFKLPHTIVFEKDGYVHTDSIFVDRGRRDYRSMKEEWRREVGYQYDLYLDNVGEDFLHIMEIYPSKPEYVRVEYSHGSGMFNATEMYRDNDQSASFSANPDVDIRAERVQLGRFNTCGLQKDLSEFCNVPKTLELTGPLRIAPGGLTAYVGTLVFNENVIKEGGSLKDKEEHFLGYLHLRCNKVFISIALEYLADGSKHKNEAVVARPNMNTMAEMGEEDEEKFKVGDGGAMDHRSSSKKKVLKIPHKTSGISLQKCDPGNPHNEVVKASQAPHYDASRHHGSVHAAVPGKIHDPKYLDFGLLTSIGQERKLGISVTNTAGIPLQLMHHSVHLEAHSQVQDKERNWNQITERYQRRVASGDAYPKGDSDSEIHSIIQPNDSSRVIKPGSTVQDFVQVLVNISSKAIKSLQSDEPTPHQGLVILRFGPADLSFEDWKKSVIQDPASAQNYVVEIPLLVHVIKGVIEYDAFQTFFPASYSIQSSFQGNLRETSKCTSGFDRGIVVENNFALPLTLKAFAIKQGYDAETDEILSNDCAESFQIIDFRKDSSESDTEIDNIYTPPGGKIGEIVIRYNYMDLSEGESRFRSAKKCTLIVETNEIGDFHIPLWVYFGLVNASPERLASPTPCRKGGLFGMDCIDALDQASSIGKILGSALRKKSKEKNEVIEKSTLMSRVQSYLLSTRSRKHVRGTFFEPIVISLGAMSSDSFETRSLFITNHNPIPLNITASVSSMEGMAIRLGRTPSKMEQFIQNAKVPAKDKEQKETYRLRSKWAKMYLTEIPGIAGDVMKSFSYRDDISLSPTASKTMKMLFHGTATMQMHRTSRTNTRLDADETKKETNQIFDGAAHSSGPPQFINEVFTDSLDHTSTNTPIRALLATADNSVIQSLKVMDESIDTKPSTWTIPPGGVARLEVLIKSPSKLALRGRDFAEVITSGLILETNLGQFMPIIATYRTLSGKLDLGFPKNAAVSEANAIGNDVIKIPPVMRSRQFKVLGRSDVTDIQLHNMFAKNVSVKEIRSCNEWFVVDLDPFFNMLPEKAKVDNIGTNSSITITARSFLDCLYGTDSLNPSFYHCALQWLQKKQHVEESRCSINLDVIDTASDNDSKAGIKAIDSIRAAVEYMDSKYGRIESKYRAFTGAIGTLNPETHRIVQQAQLEWKRLSQMGFNKIKGVVQAKFDLVEELNSDNVPEPMDSKSPVSPSITTTFNSFLQTELHIPSVLEVKGEERILRFEPTRVSEVSELYVQVRNPSGYPMTARLTSLANINSQFFIQRNRSDSNPWWTGKSFYLPDERGAIVLSEHNITIQTQGGSKLSLQSPSLHATSALFHGCAGRRCGIEFDNHQKESMHVPSVLGASAATGVHLSGRLYNIDGTVNYDRIYNHTAKQPFALGLDATTEITLPPFFRAKLGPLYFRPTSRGEFAGILALENSMTGVEVLDIRGQGAIEKIEFFDTDGNSGRGGDIEMRYGKSALMFKDDDRDEYGRAIKAVFVANLGDVPVKVSDIYLAASEVSTKGQVIQKRIDLNKCNRRGFRLLGCQPLNPDSDDDSSKNTFILHPNHSKTLHISHKYDCNFKSMYVSLILEHGDEAKRGRSNNMKRKFSELLIGHEMNEGLAKKCRSSKMWHLGVESWRKKHEDKNSSYSSYGVYIWTSLVPILIFSAILLDMIISAKQRYTSNVAFQGAISVSPRKQSKSKKTGFKNWSSAYRCLSRADPSSADLIQLGREQSRQILLNTYRRESMLQPQCVLPNGTFTREPRERKHSISKTGEGQQSPEMKRHSGSTNKTTLNDAIFSKQCTFDTAYRDVPVMPCGLGWRVLSAMRERSASNAQLTASEGTKLNKSKNRTQPSQKAAIPVDLSTKHRPSERVEQKTTKTSLKISTSEPYRPIERKSNTLPTEVNMGPNKIIVDVRSANKPKKTHPPKVTMKPISREISASSPQEPTKSKSEVFSRDSIAPTEIPTRRTKYQKKEVEQAPTPIIQSTKKEGFKSLREKRLHQNSVQGKIAVTRITSVDIEGVKKSVTQKNSVKENKELADSHISLEEEKAEKVHKAPSLVSEDAVVDKVKEHNVEPSPGLPTKKEGEKRPGAISTAALSSSTEEEVSLHRDNDQSDISDTGFKEQEALSKGSVQPTPNKDTKSNGQENKKLQDDAKHQAPKSLTEVEKIPIASEERQSDASDTKSQSSSVCMSSTTSDRASENFEDKSGTKKSPKGKNSRKKRRNQKQKDDLTIGSDKGSENNSHGPRKENSEPDQQIALKERSHVPERQPSEKSVGGLSLTSEDSGSTTSLPRTPPRKVLNIRPPPGFAPPPGFESGPSVKIAEDPSPMKHEEMTDNLSDNTILNQPLLTSPDIIPFDDKDDIEDKPLLGLGQDLNVMNFLNFLDESLDHGSGEDNDENQPVGTTEDNNYAPLSLNIGGIPGLSISNNPWSESHTPRAHAYGFDFEQEQGVKEYEGNDPSGGSTMNSDLLTPAMILGQHSSNDNEGENDDDPFDADAFFASLLNNE